MHALQHADDEVIHASETQGPKLLRWALALVFIWFGALKLRPGGNAIEDLAGDTVHRLSGGRIPRRRAIFGLGLVEITVGLGLLSQRLTRPTLALMGLHLMGASSPLVVFPKRCFSRPGSPTVEGHYIIKNVVLAAAGFELASRAGRGRRGTETREPALLTEAAGRAAEGGATRRGSSDDRQQTPAPQPRWRSSSR